MTKRSATHLEAKGGEVNFLMWMKSKGVVDIAILIDQNKL